MESELIDGLPVAPQVARRFGHLTRGLTGWSRERRAPIGGASRP